MHFRKSARRAEDLEIEDLMSKMHDLSGHKRVHAVL